MGDISNSKTVKTEIIENKFIFIWPKPRLIYSEVKWKQHWNQKRIVALFHLACCQEAHVMVLLPKRHNPYKQLCVFGWLNLLTHKSHNQFFHFFFPLLKELGLTIFVSSYQIYFWHYQTIYVMNWPTTRWLFKARGDKRMMKSCLYQSHRAKKDPKLLGALQASDLYGQVLMGTQTEVWPVVISQSHPISSSASLPV